ncbi:hypothetical protein [Methanogenium cariaci]|uniref:hypothetical protein n=1 Tax=Methanogenium cariaci TaxID=2197 RepID=UPI0007836C7F|nr:hypothetical protein [Methanogenium cariaci]
MHKKSPPEQATACPLFAEWKLTDAAREFSTTMGIPRCLPRCRNSPCPTLSSPDRQCPPIFLLPSPAADASAGGHRFFFGLEAVAGTSSSSLPPSPRLSDTSPPSKNAASRSAP